MLTMIYKVVYFVYYSLLTFNKRGLKMELINIIEVALLVVMPIAIYKIAIYIESIF